MGERPSFIERIRRMDNDLEKTLLEQEDKKKEKHDAIFRPSSRERVVVHIVLRKIQDNFQAINLDSIRQHMKTETGFLKMAHVIATYSMEESKDNMFCAFELLKMMVPVSSKDRAILFLEAVNSCIGIIVQNLQFYTNRYTVLQQYTANLWYRWTRDLKALHEFQSVSIFSKLITVPELPEFKYTKEGRFSKTGKKPNIVFSKITGYRTYHNMQPPSILSEEAIVPTIRFIIEPLEDNIKGLTSFYFGMVDPTRHQLHDETMLTNRTRKEIASLSPNELDWFIRSVLFHISVTPLLISVTQFQHSHPVIDRVCWVKVLDEVCDLKEATAAIFSYLEPICTLLFRPAAYDKFWCSKSKYPIKVDGFWKKPMFGRSKYADIDRFAQEDAVMIKCFKTIITEWIYYIDDQTIVETDRQLYLNRIYPELLKNI